MSYSRPLKIRQFIQKYNLGELLTTTNPKVEKSYKVLNIPTAVLHLLPKYRGTCPFAGTCASICLHKAGNPAYMKGKDAARKRRTDAFMDDRELFMEYLLIELVKFRHKHINAEMCGFRPNGTSDIMWEKESITVSYEVSAYLYRAFAFYILPGRYRNIFYALRECSTWYSYPEASGKAMFSFYDYTKRTDRLWHVCEHDGYHLTLSHGSSADTFSTAMHNQLNIAAAFNVKRGQELPAYVYMNGVHMPVLDGDVTDFRPADLSDKRYVVGVRMKRVPNMTEDQVKNFVVA